MSSRLEDFRLDYVEPEVKVAVGFGLIIPVKEKLNLYIFPCPVGGKAYFFFPFFLVF